MGALSGLFLISDEAPAGRVVSVRRRALPVVVKEGTAAVRPPVALAAPTPQVRPPAPAPVASADPRDLARALPEPSAAGQLAALLRDADPAVAVAAAEALGKTREGRSILVAHLARVVESPGLDHLACLEALAGFGLLEDLPILMPWTAREDSVGDLAGWCVRAICARERADLPEGLRPAVPELDAEVRPGA